MPNFSVTKLLKRIEENKPEHIALLIAWSLLILLSFVVVDAELLSYIHQNAYTKVGFVVLIQGIAFALLMLLKTSKSKTKEAN
ncbi:hypothetical protein EAY39_07840 [Vibrio anguillarum]|uniref:hypothetical protein n=2 Tax=Vibrio anguillarum TaxID=55601 RepID=UPI0018C2DA08|nr:hypothetical protein [Vibrio anguillarum]EGQ7707451.1 hypothetical protein [Vibrio cholerae]MBF4340698.1 hypothetical protein [Vibrio anguillarum]